MLHTGECRRSTYFGFGYRARETRVLRARVCWCASVLAHDTPYVGRSDVEVASGLLMRRA
jgi:hypothetical protein